MKLLYLTVPAGLLALLAGCTTYPVVVSAPAAAPAVVATVPSTLIDSDGDGVADIYDRYPYDWHYR